MQFDRTAIIERGMDGTIVYLIKVSFLKKNEERGLELDADARRAKLFPSLGIHFIMLSSCTLVVLHTEYW